MLRTYHTPLLDARALICASRDVDRLTIRTLVPFPEGSGKEWEPVHLDDVRPAVFAHLEKPMLAATVPMESARCFLGDHLRSDLEGRRYMERGATTFDIAALGRALEPRTTWGIAIGLDCAPQAPFNRTAETLVERRTTAAALAVRSALQVATISAPLEAASLDACSVGLFINPEHGIVADFDIGPDVRTLEDFAVFPRLRVEGPASCAPGGTVTLKVQVLDGHTSNFMRQPTRLWLEETGGYLPHRRVETSEGEVEFRWTALGLLPGEQARVKIGWRLWPSAAEHTITVA